MVYLLISLFITTASGAVFEEMDSPSAQGIAFTGTVKTIAVNNDEIKIKMSGKEGEDQLFKFCPQANFSANDPAVKTKLDLLNEAMKTGRSLTITYSSVFDRCLNSVEMASVL